jgi:hypothetical protein
MLLGWYGGPTPEKVTVSGITAGINGKLYAGGGISGTITDAADAPLSGVSVSIYPSSQSLSGHIGYIFLPTTVSGTYSFNGLASGTYKVKFTKPGMQTVWYGGAATQSAATPITVTAPNETTGINIVMEPYKMKCTVEGTGNGTVTSNPKGISCVKGSEAGCSASFPDFGAFSLNATPDAVSIFSGWTEDCSGVITCTLDVNASHRVTALFTAAPMAKIGDIGYGSLNAAYLAAGTESAIHALDTVLSEELVMESDKMITLKGGFKADYSSQSGNRTVLSGTLFIRNGRLNVEALAITPDRVSP